MKGHSRTENFLRNFSVGLLTQIIQMLLPFVTRTIFIYKLGDLYNGIGGLFSNILSVLSLAELGLGNVLIYSLYKPLAEGNKERIKTLLFFFKKIYTFIACSILVLGMMLLPFLGYIVKAEEVIQDISLYYILFLLNSAISYLYVYKTSVIRADQKIYIISIYSTLSNIIMNGVQIVLLLFYSNYMVYLVIQILFTFGQNWVLSKKADRMYGLKNLTNDMTQLTIEEKKKIFYDAKAMFSYKIGGVLLNSTDNILISSLISTITVGFYSNYLCLINIPNRVINILYDSVIMGIGNLNATEGTEKKKFMFNVLCLGFNWIAVICSVGILTAINPAIAVWLGEGHLLEQTVVYSIVLNFFLPITLYPVWIYRNTTGLFKETQNILFFTGTINIFLSIVLGKIYGLAGILNATIISRLLTSFWYEPLILYKKRFENGNVIEYFIKIINAFLIVVISYISVQLCTSRIHINPLGIFFIKGICSVLFSCMYLLLYSVRTEEFKYIIGVGLRKFLKRG